MAGKQKLVKQIVEKLRTDTGAGSLVTLTGHTGLAPNGFRIARDKPQSKRRSPFLGVEIPQGLPLISSTHATMIKQSRVEFNCYSVSEVVAEKIADRLEDLLDDKLGQTNVSFYNFSGPDVSNRMTMFAGRTGADFDGENDVWVAIVAADVIWATQPQCF